MQTLDHIEHIQHCLDKVLDILTKQKAEIDTLKAKVKVLEELIK